MALTVAGVAVSFLLDLVIPGYAIAGLYLVPLLLVAFVLRERRIVALVGVLCLALTVLMMIVQGRADSQNILLIVFGALAGSGLIVLGSMYQRFDQLYENERSTTARLHSLAAQVQRLQEVSVLDSDRPLSELLLDIVRQARQLLGSDGGSLFRFEAAEHVLSLQAADGLSDDRAPTPLPIGERPPRSGGLIEAAGGPARRRSGAKRCSQSRRRLPRLPGGAFGRARRCVRRDRAVLRQGHDL